MSSKVKDVVRARIRDRIRARQYLDAEPIATPQKTKAEIQDELDAAGVEYPKNARKAELEALLTSDLAAEDIEEAKTN